MVFEKGFVKVVDRFVAVLPAFALGAFDDVFAGRRLHDGNEELLNFVAAGWLPALHAEGLLDQLKETLVHGRLSGGSFVSSREGAEVEQVDAEFRVEFLDDFGLLERVG